MQMLTQSSNKSEKKENGILLIIQNLSKRVILQICIKSLSVSIVLWSFFNMRNKIKTLIKCNSFFCLCSKFKGQIQRRERGQKRYQKGQEQSRSSFFLQRWRPLIVGLFKGTSVGSECNHPKLLDTNINTVCFQRRSGFGKTLLFYKLFDRYERTN